MCDLIGWFLVRGGSYCLLLERSGWAGWSTFKVFSKCTTAIVMVTEKQTFLLDNVFRENGF